MTVDQVLQQAQALSIEERKQLIKALIDMLDADPAPPRTRSILDFIGVGAHLYDGTDAQEYVNKLREEWDERDERWSK